MTTKARSILLAALMIMSVVVGGVAATTEWQDASSADQNLDILQDTDESVQSYNLTVNASGVAVDSGSDEIVLASQVDPTNLSSHSVTTASTDVAETTSGWTYDSDTDLWYRAYNATADPGEVTFEVTEGVIFNATDETDNKTISTSSLTDETRLAGGFAGDDVSVDVLANASTDVTYEIIDDPVQVDTTFASDIDNGTSMDASTVTVDPQTSELTVTLDAENVSDKDRGVGDSVTYTVVLNKSLGTVSETTVSATDADNVDVTGPSSYTDDQNSWDVAVTNISNESTVSMEVNVSDINETAFEGTDVLTLADIDYDASVVGETVHDQSYSVEFDTLAPGGATLIAFPGLDVFTNFLGGTWGAVAFWFLLGSVIIMAGMAIWQLREQDFLSSSGSRMAAYLGIAGSPVAAIVIFGFALGMDTIAAALIVALAAALAILNIWLYTKGQSMSVQTGGGSGGATYVR